MIVLDASASGFGVSRAHLPTTVSLDRIVEATDTNGKASTHRANASARATRANTSAIRLIVVAESDVASRALQGTTTRASAGRPSNSDCCKTYFPASTSRIPTKKC